MFYNDESKFRQFDLLVLVLKATQPEVITVMFFACECKSLKSRLEGIYFTCLQAIEYWEASFVSFIWQTTKRK